MDKCKETLEGNTLLLAYDLYVLRYHLAKDWYEVHDLIKAELNKNGHIVRYEKDDIKIGIYSPEHFDNIFISMKEIDEREKK